MRALRALLPKLLAVSLPFLVGCASGARAPEENVVEDAIRHERFAEAVRLAARLAEERPGPEAEALQRRATVAWLIDEGRRATFEDRDEEALALFERAARLAPNSDTARTWVNKTRRKIARRWETRGAEHFSSGELEEARAAYEKALEYWPGDELALRGLAAIEVLTDYHEERATHYYHEGVRAFAEYWLERARSRFSYAEKYRPGDERAERREDQVSALIAQQRLLVAEELEERGLWAAAADEYRLALRLDPSKEEEIRPRLERAEREARARELLTAAEMAALRGERDEARKLLAEGRALTVAQTDRFDEMEERLAEVELQQLYQHALDLERDYRYEEAIAAYDELLAKTDFYLDARARRDTLAEYVAEARRLWEEAEAAPDDATRLDLLRQIEVFWPEYRDLQDRLRELTEGVEGADAGR